MRRIHLALGAALAAFALPLAVHAQTAPATPTTPAAVKVMKMGDKALLTDTKGMTLYVYDADAAGKSTCNGPCASSWPPLTADANAKVVGKYTIVTRDDGAKQWAYDGKPLYMWSRDKSPGDATGDGVGGKWHIARP
jgi:predicted lipoprotein with Yx(FWY)xxD motif